MKIAGLERGYYRGSGALLRTAAAVVLFLFLLQPALGAEYTVAHSGGNFTSIQEAVVHARSGDTILVFSGLYNETVIIDKKLTVRGVNDGHGTPVIEPNTRGDVVQISAHGCTFANFVIRNARLLSGITITSDNNTISGVTVTSCSQGISLMHGDNNLISGNNITENTRSGIALEISLKNRIENNNIRGNSIGISLDGYSQSNRIHYNNFDNTINVASKSVNSVWSSETPYAYRYLGINQSSRLGNYWEDYNGNDANGDGIGDTAYNIQVGANKNAVLPVNQNTADTYPLMDPKEYYQVQALSPGGMGVQTSAAPTTAPAAERTTDPVAPAEPSAPAGILPLGFMGLEYAPFSAIIIFCIVAGLAAGMFSFLYRRAPADEREHGGIIVPQRPQPAFPAAYVLLGIVTGILSLVFMAALAEIPPESPVNAGAWMFCVLTATISVSSFFLAKAAWQLQPFPALATLHAILSALGIPFSALLLLSVPGQPVFSVLIMVVCLAVLAALPFRQQWKTMGGSLLPETEAIALLPKQAAPVPPVPDTTVPQGITMPGQTGGNPATPAARESYFPRELEGKYSDTTVIGKGGIAWVYGATRKSDGRKVAIKIPISFDEMTGKSFLNEIKAWETLRHKNIVEVTAVNILPVPYVEMEFVPGSLETVAKPLPVWKAVYIVRGIADALSYAHSQNIVHRDIKPHNILVTEDLTPKITDWGMSKVMAADSRKSSIAGFSLSYAAPEQVSPAEYGRTDVRTDIYQLGVVFYELVTGSIPFGGESIVAVGNAILRDPPIPPSEYTPEASAVDRIILRCLEKDPAKRYQSAKELLNALSGYLDEDEP